MAAAYVSGAAALLFSIEPDATADSVRAGLQGSAVNPTGSTRDPVFGHGRIDVCAAADSISAGQTTCPAIAP
jgi:serine protease